MSRAERLGTPRVLVPPAHPDAYHLTCCREGDPGDVALCGMDVSGEAWAGDDDTLACAPCAHLEHTNYCPAMLTCSRMAESEPT